MTDAPSQDSLDRVDWLTFGLTSLVALVGYWFTLAPNVTLEFSGLLSTGAMYAGVPHVPGYPVWTLYSWLFTTLLPFSNIAWRVAVGSAVASAMACGLVALMVSRCGARMFADGNATRTHAPREQFKLRVCCGAVAGLTLAFSNPVWRVAVIADTAALSLLLFAGHLAVLMRWLPQPDTKWLLASGFLCFGLLLTSNQELIVALPGMIAAAMIGRPAAGRDVAAVMIPLATQVTLFNQYGIWTEPWGDLNWPLLSCFLLALAIAFLLILKTRRFGTEWRIAVLCGIAFLLGFAFYLYVPIASMTTPPVNWGYPRTVEGYLHVIGRGQYEKITVIVCDPLHFLQLWQQWMARVAGGVGWVQLFVVAMPACFFGQLGRTTRRWLLVFAAFGFCVGPLLLAELNPPTDRRAQELIERYFGVTYAVLAVWLGVGLLLCARLLARDRDRDES